MRVTLVLMLTAFFPAVALAGDPSGDGTADVSSSSGFWERGHIDLGYSFRAANGHDLEPHEQDQYMTQSLFFEAGYGDHFRMELSAMTRQEIAGVPNDSRFQEIYDTYGSQWALYYLYTAYAEGLDVGPFERIRLGRQYLEDGVDIRFDGGLAETAALGDLVKFIVYGGIPVQFFESSVRGDWIAGGAVDIVAIPRTDVRFDYTHVTDYWPTLARANALVGLPADDLLEDNRYQATIVTRPLEELKLLARVTTFGGHSTRAEAEALYQDSDLGLSVRGHYALQDGAYQDLSLQYTPLSEQLGPVDPYQEITLDVTQVLGDYVTLGAGGSYRALFHEHDEGPFNHSYGRVYAQASVTGWPWDGLSVDFSLDYYRGIAMGTTFEAVGSISQDVGYGFKVGIGSGYSAFTFDQFFLTEEDDVRTYFVDAEWRPTKFLRFKVSYSYETDSEDRFHVVECHARFDF